MNKSGTRVLMMALFIIMLIVLSSGCTFDSGTLINQKKENNGDIVQYTSNIAESNNNSCHITGLVENKADKDYNFVNLTIKGYNAQKKVISEGKLMISHVSAYDYETYDIWLRTPTGEKITSTNMEFINGTKG
jgi:hypothetical protein